MPTPAQVRQQIAKGTADPIYLLLGDDDAEIARLAADLTSLVEDELRVFNVERMYAGEKSTTPAAIVQACRQIPMMGERRVVVVLRGERLLKPKRRSKDEDLDRDGDADAEPPSDMDALTEYVQNPSPTTTLVIAAADIDKTRKAGKAIVKH